MRLGPVYTFSVGDTHSAGPFMCILHSLSHIVLIYYVPVLLSAPDRLPSPPFLTRPPPFELPFFLVTLATSGHSHAQLATRLRCRCRCAVGLRLAPSQIQFPSRHSPIPTVSTTYARPHLASGLFRVTFKVTSPFLSLGCPCFVRLLYVRSPGPLGVSSRFTMILLWSWYLPL